MKKSLFLQSFIVLFIFIWQACGDSSQSSSSGMESGSDTIHEELADVAIPDTIALTPEDTESLSAGDTQVEATQPEPEAKIKAETKDVSKVIKASENKPTPSKSQETTPEKQPPIPPKQTEPESKETGNDQAIEIVNPPAVKVEDPPEVPEEKPQVKEEPAIKPVIEEVKTEKVDTPVETTPEKKEEVPKDIPKTIPQGTNPWIVPPAANSKANPIASDNESLKIGKSLYNKHCKSCHGKSGLGDGSKADQLDTPSGDFTLKSFQDQTDGALFYKSKFGRDDMPSYKKKIPDDEDIWHIVNYMRTFKE